MNNKSILKHIDFIIADILILQASFYLACRWYSNYSGKRMLSVGSTQYRMQAMVLVLCVIASIAVGNPYKNVLKRDKFKELKSTLMHTLHMALFDVVALYFLHMGNTSRLTTGITWVIYFILQLGFRYIWKRVVRTRITNSGEGSRNAMVVFTESQYAESVVNNLVNNAFTKYNVNQLFLLDYDSNDSSKYAGVKPSGDKETLINYCVHNRVDEVTFYLPDDIPLYLELKEEMENMGINLHRIIYRLKREESEYDVTKVEKLGNFIVTSTVTRDVPPIQYFLKRVLDIVGGIVGSLITLILTIFIGPAIYAKSPGPIFFTQERVGKNGKTFKMIKFRSMYLDAEERKAALMKQNNIKDGMMFKMDDDPRIIGSEKKDKNGNPKGIGNFIRKTSLDEFPQFFNVLKGDMSIVGTRPPTIDEWQKYEAHHRKRLAMKPGITGLWQISGRSDITDFDEVVRLDSQYIDTWTVAGDIKIILKTVGVVLKHDGAK